MRNQNRETVFKFKQFEIVNNLSAMKVGTDGVLLGAWAASCDDEATDLPTHLAATADTSAPNLRILDIGCGTGLIALMLAQRFPTASICGVEIDSMAASEAAYNFEHSPWPNRLKVIKGDICMLSSGELGGKFDIIVSNPPFFNNGVMAPETSRQQARHETALPLSKLLTAVATLLNDSGSFSVVLPSEREDDLKYRAVVNKLALKRLTRVTTVPHKQAKRILAELSLQPTSVCVESSLSIKDSNNKFSSKYSDLTKDFYLNF